MTTKFTRDEIIAALREHSDEDIIEDPMSLINQIWADAQEEKRLVDARARVKVSRVWADDREQTRKGTEVLQWVAARKGAL